MVIFLIPYDFCHSWAKLGPMVAKHLQGRINGQINSDSHQWRVYWAFYFLNVLIYQFDIHSVGCATY